MGVYCSDGETYDFEGLTANVSWMYSAFDLFVDAITICSVATKYVNWSHVSRTYYLFLQ
jgi:hypothetical protein